MTKIARLPLYLAAVVLAAGCGAGGTSGSGGVSNSSLQIPSQVSVVTAN
jgi:hypothetical protein